MTLTAEQRETRRQYIGASDAPAICGVDPYRNAADVFTEKVFETADLHSDAIDAGNRLEPLLLDWTEEKIGAQFERGHSFTRGQFIAHPDGWLPGLKQTAQAKTTGLAAGWGDDPNEANAVPDKLLVQTAIEFYCTGAELAWVPVLIGDFGLRFRLYHVNRSDDLIAAVVKRCAAFYDQHVLPKVPPADTLPALDILKRIRREPSKTIELDDAGPLLAVQEARDRKRAAIKECEATEAALLALMGDADGIKAPTGTATYLEIKRRGYTVEPTTYRQLRLKIRKDG